LLQVGVGKDDHRRFAPELEAAGLERAGRAGEHLLRGRARADELDLVDAGMRDHRRADIGAAGDQVDHSRRETGFQDQFDQLHDGVGGKVGRFHDDAIARRQRRRHHHGGGEQRSVPRDDRTDHAVGFVMHVIVRRPAPGRDGAALDLVGPAAVIAELLRGIMGHVARAEQDRSVFGHQAGHEFLRLRFQQGGKTKHQVTALVAGQGAPGGEGRARGGDGAIDIRRSRERELARDAAGRGVDVGDRRAAACLLAADRR
jgi:hypothetical protein